MDKYKKLKAIGASILLVGAGMLSGFALDQPQTIEKEVPGETVYVDVPGETIIEVQKEIVEVDNGNLKLVLDEIYDNDGNVEYLTEDLDDDEVDQMVDRIAFANEVKSLAVQEVKSQLADELDNKEVTLEDESVYEFDEDDFEKIRIDDEADEIELDNVDYDDKDADVIVTGRFRHDDKWFSFEAEVEIEDGEVEDFEVNSVLEE